MEWILISAHRVIVAVEVVLSLIVHCRNQHLVERVHSPLVGILQHLNHLENIASSSQSIPAPRLGKRLLCPGNNRYQFFIDVFFPIGVLDLLIVGSVGGDLVDVEDVALVKDLVTFLLLAFTAEV